MFVSVHYFLFDLLCTMYIIHNTVFLHNIFNILTSPCKIWDIDGKARVRSGQSV